MVTPDIKRLAYATMDHAVAFELHVVSTPPEGEHVVELARGQDLAEVLPVARFVSQMARNFFAAKLRDRVTAVETGCTVGLFVVATLPELEDLDLADLSEEGAPPSSDRS